MSCFDLFLVAADTFCISLFKLDGSLPVTSQQAYQQARSQELAMGGLFDGLGAEPPAIENHAFFAKIILF